MAKGRPFRERSKTMPDQEEAGNTKEETTRETLTIKEAQSLAVKTYVNVANYTPFELGSEHQEPFVKNKLIILDGHMEAINRYLNNYMSDMADVDTENKLFFIELLIDQLRSLILSMISNDRMKCEFSLAGILQIVLASSERYKIDLAKVFLSLNTSDIKEQEKLNEIYAKCKAKDEASKHIPGSVLESETE